LGQQVPAFRNDPGGEVACLIFRPRLDPLKMDKAGGKHMAILVEHRPQRVQELSALMDQALPASEHHRLGLLLCRLRRNEPHLRLARGDYDGLGISRVVFLMLDEGTYVLRRDEFDFMAKRFHFPCPVIGAATSLEHDDAGRLLQYEPPELLPCQLLAELYLPDHRILHLAVFLAQWLSTPPSWHISMSSGGGIHPINSQWQSTAMKMIG
jgi:hypothetical protein